MNALRTALAVIIGAPGMILLFALWLPLATIAKAAGAAVAAINAIESAFTHLIFDRLLN